MYYEIHCFVDSCSFDEGYVQIAKCYLEMHLI